MTINEDCDRLLEIKRETRRRARETFREISKIFTICRGVQKSCNPRAFEMCEIWASSAHFTDHNYQSNGTSKNMRE